MTAHSSSVIRKTNPTPQSNCNCTDQSHQSAGCHISEHSSASNHGLGKGGQLPLSYHCCLCFLLKLEIRIQPQPLHPFIQRQRNQVDITMTAADSHTTAASLDTADVDVTKQRLDSQMPVRVGVLALQGSFREHMALLSQLPGVHAVEVRTKDELSSVAGLIIPGGESTTMALVAEQLGLIQDLQAFAKAGRPVWGTCAGMIFLAERAQGQKKGGQALLGGLDICVSRNFFGAQINSFETQLAAHNTLQQYGPDSKFRAVFIRAPAVLEAGPQVEVLAEYQLQADESAAQAGLKSVAVAVRQGPLLATAFHPELTRDLRWHQMFVDMVRQDKQALEAAAAAATKQQLQQYVKGTRPADLPIYGREFMSRE